MLTNAFGLTCMCSLYSLAWRYYYSIYFDILIQKAKLKVFYVTLQ